MTWRLISARHSTHHVIDTHSNPRLLSYAASHDVASHDVASDSCQGSSSRWSWKSTGPCAGSACSVACPIENRNLNCSR